MAHPTAAVYQRWLSSAPTGDVYTHGHHASVVCQHAARTAANSAAFLLPSLRPGARLLDVGCGPGSITVGLAEHLGPAGSVVGIDSAPAVLEQAAAAVAAAGLASRVALEPTSVYELAAGHRQDSFDVAYAHQTLQHLARPVAALGEMVRAVRPGGLVAVRDADYSSMLGMCSSPTALEGIDAWRRIYRATCYRNGAEPDAGRHLLRWAREAGLPLDALSYTASVVVYSPSDDAFRRKWGTAWAERTMESDFARQAVAYGIATEAELQAVSAAWREWAEDDSALFSYVNGELLVTVPRGTSG